MKKVTKPKEADILEFLRLSRTIKRQLNLLKVTKLPPDELAITKEVARDLAQTALIYIDRM